MPKSVGERRRRCLKVMHRESPTSSPHASNAEDNKDDSSPVPDVIDALMGLSYSMTDDATGEFAVVRLY